MSESSNFNRLIQLLAKGGTMVLRQVLDKCTAPLTTSEYIYQNQASVLKLKFTDKQLQRITGLEIDKMDISLLCKLIFGIFNNVLTDKEKQNIRAIKSERDAMMHSDFLELAKIPTHMFERRWHDIATALLNTADELQPSIKRELEKFIDKTKNSDPELREIIQTLQEWCQSNTELQEKVDALAKSVEDLKESQIQASKITQMSKCDGLIDKFHCHYDYNTAVNIQLTQKMTEARSYLSESYTVFILGRAGEGKTTAAFRLVKCLVDDNIVSLDKCAFVYEPDDLKSIRSSDVDLLFIDDIFGKHNAEASKLTSWRSFFPTLQAFVGTRKVRLIFASRIHIYLEYKRELSEYNIFSRTVDLASAEMTTEEKKCILQSQLQAHDREMSSDDVEECVFQFQTNVGFPLCAQQFASDNFLFSKKAAYFARPFNYIQQNIQNMDDESFIALLYVFYKRNKLPASEINLTKMSEKSKKEIRHISSLRGNEMPIAKAVKAIRKIVNNLEGSYLKFIDGTFSFLHDTIYETVAKIHAEDFPDEIIKHCTVDYLCQCIRLENDGDDHHIFIDIDDYESLAERCVKEVIETEVGRRLSKHPMFQNEAFISALISIITTNDKLFVDFLTKGLSFNYVGIHSILYHNIVNDNGEFYFLKGIKKYLSCDHHGDSNELCWKCKVKLEALCAVCAINRKDMYAELREENAQVTTFCLYKAVEHKDADQELVQMIISDLKLAGNYLPDDQDLQRCLGLAMVKDDTEISEILKKSGLHYSNNSLYFAVKHGDEELVKSILNELKRTKTWMPDDMFTVRALTEAHVSGKNNCMSILTKAGAHFTAAAVYWATIEQNMAEVEYAIEKLKEDDTFDPESYMMAWSLAIALENDDRGIYDLLKREGVIPTTSLLYALAEIGHNVDGIRRVIEEIKLIEKWDPESLPLAGAYMASCKRADHKLTDLLVSEGAAVNPACLVMTVVRHHSDIRHVLSTLKDHGQLDPANRYIARAIVRSIDYNDKRIYDLFVSEGLYVTMPGLPAAVKMMTINTVEKVIDDLKKSDRWNPDDESALEALNGACIKQDKTTFDMLINAGLKMKPKNLVVAIEYESVHEVKLIIAEMRKLGLLNPPFEDVKDAVSIARSLKDQRKLKLLISEGICG